MSVWEAKSELSCLVHAFSKWMDAKVDMHVKDILSTVFGKSFEEVAPLDLSANTAREEIKPCEICNDIHYMECQMLHGWKYCPYCGRKWKKEIVKQADNKAEQKMLQFPIGCDECYFQHKCKNRTIIFSYGGLECTRIWDNYKKKDIKYY